MSRPNDGGPAFPCAEDHDIGALGSDGMSLRDYFAAKAAQGLMSSPRYYSDSVRRIALTAYEVADAMLAAREAKS